MRFITSLCIFGLAISVCSVSHAQQDRKKRANNQNDRPGQQRNILQVLKRLDKNNDSEITVDEVPERMRERVARIDTDENGIIDAEELQAVANRMKQLGQRDGAKGKGKDAGNNTDKKKMGSDMQMQPGNERDMLAGLMRRLDKNDDQKISKDEAPERLQRGWDRLDQDGNDVLEGDELQQLIQMAARQFRDGKGARGNRRMSDAKDKGRPGAGVKPKRPGSGK